jgi:hypothetical protein
MIPFQIARWAKRGLILSVIWLGIVLIIIRPILDNTNLELTINPDFLNTCLIDHPRGYCMTQLQQVQDLDARIRWDRAVAVLKWILIPLFGAWGGRFVMVRWLRGKPGDG